MPAFKVKNSLFLISLLLINSIELISQNKKELVLGEQPLYKAVKAKDAIIADGKMDEPSWQNAEERSLDHFFSRDKPADEPQTTIRMLWDVKNLYRIYEFQDTSLTAKETQHDGRTYLDDCAEFFVLPAPVSSNTHFGFRVNFTKMTYTSLVLWQLQRSRSVVFPVIYPECGVCVA